MHRSNDLERETLRKRRPVLNSLFARPWLVILLAGVVGVPAVFIGLSLVALVFAVVFVNPVTWFLIGATWFALGFRHYRHRLTIRDTPMSKIDAAAIGLVEVSGRVRSNTQATAPITGKSCVYWRAKVVLRKDNQSTILAEHQSSASCFEIEDDTGQMLIWPWASELIVTDTQKWEGGAAAELAHNLPSGLLRETLTRLPAQDRHHLVVTEEKIEVGKTLYVIGVLSERRHVAKPQPFWDNIQGKFRPKPASSPVAAANPGTVEAGKVFLLAIVMVVWGLATGKFFSLPGKSSTQASEEPPDVDPNQVLIWRGEQDRPFIIADTPEGIVIRTLTQWTKLGLLGGAGTMIGTLILYLGGFFS